MSIFVRVKWHHSLPADPVLLYSELNDNRWEIRKVEVFADGHCDYATELDASGDTRLSTEPIPTLDEIAADPQFEPSEISSEEFEKVWQARG